MGQNMQNLLRCYLSLIAPTGPKRLSFKDQRAALGRAWLVKPGQEATADLGVFIYSGLAMILWHSSLTKTSLALEWTKPYHMA